MSINTFDVDPERVRDDFFPHVTAGFTTDSPPTRETVDRWVTEAATTLQGKLLQKSLTSEDITDTESPEWVWCAETVTLIVAIRAARVMTGQSPEVAKAWQEQLDARLKDLQENAGVALGIPSTTGDQPDGPSTYINALGLVDPDPADASTLTPVIRRDDLL